MRFEFGTESVMHVEILDTYKRLTFYNDLNDTPDWIL